MPHRQRAQYRAECLPTSSGGIVLGVAVAAIGSNLQGEYAVVKSCPPILACGIHNHAGVDITFDFEAPRGFYAKTFWGGAALSGVSLFWLVAALPRFEDNLVSAIIAGIAFLVLLPLTLLNLRRLLTKTPSVTVSSAGLHIRSAVAPEGPIGWHEIAGLHEVPIKGHWMIKVILADPPGVIARSRRRKPVMYLNMWIFGSPVFIPVITVDNPHLVLQCASDYVPIQ